MRRAGDRSCEVDEELDGFAGGWDDVGRDGFADAIDRAMRPPVRASMISDSAVLKVWGLPLVQTLRMRWPRTRASTPLATVSTSGSSGIAFRINGRRLGYSMGDPRAFDAKRGVGWDVWRWEWGAVGAGKSDSGRSDAEQSIADECARFAGGSNTRRPSPCSWCRRRWWDRVECWIQSG